MYKENSLLPWLDGGSRCHLLLLEGSSHLHAHRQWMIKWPRVPKESRPRSHAAFREKFGNVHPAVTFPCVAGKAIEKLAAVAMMSQNLIHTSALSAPKTNRDTLRWPCSLFCCNCSWACQAPNLLGKWNE